MILSIISDGLYTKVIYISFLFIICLLILTSVLIAQETDSTVVSSDINDNKSESQGKNDNEEHGDNTVGFIHKYVSHGVLGAADRVDGFFGDNRAITDTNKTRIRLRLDLDFEQDESYDLSPNVFANISLPGTQKKLRLFINGDEGDDDAVESDINNNEDNGSFFLRYYFLNTKYTRLATDTGLRFRSFGVEWFGGLRSRSYFQLDEWGLRLTNKFRWYTNRKFTNVTQFDIERVVIEGKSFFRATTKGRWFERKPGYYLEQRFTLFHKINEKTGVAPEWRTLAQTNINEFIQETRVRLRIRRNVGWKWLFFEVAPGLVWKEENDFDTNYAIRFRVDAYFGNLSKIKLF